MWSEKGCVCDIGGRETRDEAKARDSTERRVPARRACTWGSQAATPLRMGDARADDT